jgi:hypothetical protein
MKMLACRDIESCSLVEIDRRFRGTYCFHHQCREKSKRDSWWTNWHWSRLFSELFGFLLLPSLHHCPILVNQSGMLCAMGLTEHRIIMLSFPWLRTLSLTQYLAGRGVKVLYSFNCKCGSLTNISFQLWSSLRGLCYARMQHVPFSALNGKYLELLQAFPSGAIRKCYKKKSKAVPLHAMEALGGRGGIAPTHSRPRH